MGADILTGTIYLCLAVVMAPIWLTIKFWPYIPVVLPYILAVVLVLTVAERVLAFFDGVKQWFQRMKAVVLRLTGYLSRVGRANDRYVAGIYRACRARFRRPRESSNENENDADTSGDTREELKHTNDPYRILGVSRNVTASELTARYRQLLKVNHPDRVAQLDPHIQAFATERSKRIIQAYETLSGQL